MTGLLSRVMLLNTGLEVPFRQSLFAYLAYEGVVEKPSGAYSFNPADDQPIDLGRRVNYSLVKVRAAWLARHASANRSHAFRNRKSMIMQLRDDGAAF